MPELILPRAIRGLANAFGFPGARTGPQGVDLSIPPQTVVDLTQFARYGSARLSESDGWMGASFATPGGGAATIATTTLTFDVANFPGIRPGDVLWIRHYGLDVTFTAALADFGYAALSVQPQTAQTFGPGTYASVCICSAVAADALPDSTTHAILGQPRASARPIGWIAVPQGSVLTHVVQQAAAAGAITGGAFIYGRILPAGVSPE